MGILCEDSRLGVHIEGSWYGLDRLRKRTLLGFGYGRAAQQQLKPWRHEIKEPAAILPGPQ